MPELSGLARYLQLSPGQRALAAVLILAAVGLSLWSGWWWVIFLESAPITLAALAAAAGWGAWLLQPLRLGQRPALQSFCLSTGLGLGLLAVATLGLGALGALCEELAWAIVALGWAAGLLAVYLRQAHRPVPAAPLQRVRGAWLMPLAAAPLAVPLVIAAYGACLPPGVLWTEENRAYDVLEYHLEAPREYFHAGRVHFLDHNVYAQFPQQMEMLYLLQMYLADGPYDAAVPAQLLHAACGLLAVVTLLAWAAPGWPRLFAALVAGCVPWVAYVGCLAYVECGLLCFAALAGALACEALQQREGPTWRLMLAMGLFAGLAGGCKYTALVMVVICLGLAWLLATRGAWQHKTLAISIYAGGALAAFSPWLIRNAVFTGNPVYPFAYAVFEGSAWSEAQAEQWERGHRVPSPNNTFVGRIRLASDESLGSAKFGWALFAVGALGLLGWNRRAAFGGVWFATSFLAWALLTHVPGRFALPLIVPLTLLAAAGLTPRWPTAGGARATLAAGALAIAALGGAWNDSTLLRLLQREAAFWNRVEKVPLGSMLVHGPGIFLVTEPLNAPDFLPPERRLWFVGAAAMYYVNPPLHYTVVFNRDPWLEYAASATPAGAVDWLRTRNVTHVVFSWPEIERLRRTYGFPEFVTPVWVAGLADAGLRALEPPTTSGPSSAAELYEVMPRDR